MTDCLHYRELAALRADGELSAAELSALERHIESCPDCRDAAAAYDALHELWRDEPVDPPETLTPSIVAAIKRQKRRAPLFTMTAAACFLLLMLVQPWKLSQAGTAGHAPQAGTLNGQDEMIHKAALDGVPETADRGSLFEDMPGEGFVAISQSEAWELLAQSNGYCRAFVIDRKAADRAQNAPPGETAYYLYVTDFDRVTQLTAPQEGQWQEGTADTAPYLILIFE